MHSAAWAIAHFVFPGLSGLAMTATSEWSTLVDHFLLNVANTLSKTKLFLGYAYEALQRGRRSALHSGSAETFWASSAVCLQQQQQQLSCACERALSAVPVLWYSSISSTTPGGSHQQRAPAVLHM
jgi:hypothetical protein